MKNMKKMKKRLNRKGFTLVELLAVIVILALIMVIAIPYVLQAMNDSRISTLHSKTKSVVRWYNTTLSSDAVSSTKVLDPNDISAISSATPDPTAGTAGWICIDTLSADFRSKAELDDANYKLGGTPPTSTTITSASTCSAIRTNGGKVEVLLVANNTGKFHVSGKTVTYAYSEDANGNTSP